MGLIPNFEDFCAGRERLDLLQVAQRLEEYYGPRRAFLTYPERASLGLYKGMEYRDVNRFMRFGRVSGASSARLDDLDETIDHIKSALARYPTPFPTVVYRGLKAGYPPPNLAVGDYLEEAAFLSTTLSMLTAKQFCRWEFSGDASTILELSVPEGTNAIWLEGISDKGEHELLLDSDTTIHISGIKVVQGYPERRYLQCQIVQSI